MKMKFAILMVLTMILVQACSTGRTSDVSSSQNSTPPPALQTSTVESSQTQTVQGGPIVITAEPASTLPSLSDAPTETEVPPLGSSPIPENGITLGDNGKIFTMNVGDSVLVNLGIDVYEWEVMVDNPDILRMKIGVMVIRGAQGIYDAIAPGATTLTASGNPLCLQSTPPCAMPSIFFTVTIIVQ